MSPMRIPNMSVRYDNLLSYVHGSKKTLRFLETFLGF